MERSYKCIKDSVSINMFKKGVKTNCWINTRIKCNLKKWLKIVVIVIKLIMPKQVFMAYLFLCPVRLTSAGHIGFGPSVCLTVRTSHPPHGLCFVRAISW